MQTVFFTGKGGVGKSSLSAALAWQLADKGNRVLATSFDPAHNLGDIFGEQLSHTKRRYQDTTLFLQETDLEQSAQEYLKANMGLLEEVYSYTRTLNMDRYFKILRYSPGVEEYAALTAMEQLFREERNNFDYLVIDTPPTGLTLRILALPTVTVTWIDRLVGIRREILDKRHTIHNIMGKYDEEGTRLAYTEKDDAVMQKLREMRDRYDRVRTTLEGADTGIAVVTNPDFLSLRESQRLLKGITELQLPLRTLFTNKVTGESEATAERLERELLGTREDVTRKRVPLIQHEQPACYIMDTDLVAPLGLAQTPGEHR
ncbi:MAG: ArsA family ATPase [Synergistales bacterium]|nr:ArsA family ATPase [Synergistales bacterium]